MKKIALYIFACSLFSLSSCSMFDLDNYEEPKETLQGEVVDKATGAPILTEQSNLGIRVRITELSWGENVEHNPDFWAKPDGTFQNTKIFKGIYNVRIDGPFIPLYRDNEYGVVPQGGDETQELEIKGTKKVKFEVEPFLNIEFVEEPTFSNGVITAKIKVKKGVSDEIFREKVQPMGNYNNNFLNVTDIQLCVGYTPTIGYENRDQRWSNSILYEGSAFNSKFDEVITIKTTGVIPAGRTIFVRAAARINYETPKGSGVRRYNYTTVKELMAP